jgi:uncharacterized RDD family membrane protein YckC
MNFAGSGLRAVEGIIDLAVSFVIVWVVGKVFGQTTEDGFNLSGMPAFIGFAVVLFYFVVMEATIGATLGKLIVKLRVVDGIVLYLTGFILICTSEKRQRLGDRVAGTVVIRRPA